ncbi:MAG: DUF924 domain-containing protein [Gammaproteobacteria bacterium]|nr:DUF924 domain-containing protein [Gammaproteobacteria bacterium]MDH3412549.1 DUF924 domain-containing protein [Gammaproteobacteria bacterium]
MDANVTPEAVREFWFGRPDPLSANIEERIDFWFAAGPDVDAEIHQRFGTAMRNALAGKLDAWQKSPPDCVALVILLDQFPRNIHRGTREAYSGDEKAYALSVYAIDCKAHRALSILERAFLYMPLQHAEDGDAQRRSVEVFNALLEESPDGLRTHIKRFLASARTHRDIIERFGRFPHRNEILGRECTQEEIEYQRAPAAPFRSKS